MKTKRSEVSAELSGNNKASNAAKTKRSEVSAELSGNNKASNAAKSGFKNPGWQSFIDRCSKFTNANELKIFFDVLFTSSEKVELGNRLHIIQELLENKKTQREIAHDLKVSIANVSRGSNVIKNSEYDLKKVLHF